MVMGDGVGYERTTYMAIILSRPDMQICDQREVGQILVVDGEISFRYYRAGP